MVKRIVVAAVVGALLVGAGLWAAAPAGNSLVYKVCDTATVSQQVSGKWQPIGGPYDLLLTDTCYVVVTVTGQATLDPYDKLYVGIRKIKTNDSTVIDTMVVYPPYGADGKAKTPFMVRWVDSLISQTDKHDTLYFNAAVGGSTTRERVFIEDVYMTATIYDKD